MDKTLNHARFENSWSHQTEQFISCPGTLVDETLRLKEWGLLSNPKLGIRVEGARKGGSAFS